MLDGKKTYILVALAFVAGLATYAQSVIANGFDFNGFLQFLKTEAVTAALAAVRLAIAKK